MTDDNLLRYALGLPYVQRVAYYAQNPKLDHVDWRMPDGKLYSGYRFEHDNT